MYDTPSAHASSSSSLSSTKHVSKSKNRKRGASSKARERSTPREPAVIMPPLPSPPPPPPPRLSPDPVRDDVTYERPVPLVDELQMDDDRDNGNGDPGHAYDVFGFMSQTEEEEKGPPRTVEVYDADAWGVSNTARQVRGFGYGGAYGDDYDGYGSDGGPDLLENAPALFQTQPEGDPIASSDVPTPESPLAQPASVDDNNNHLMGDGQEVDAGFGALSSILESVRPVHDGKRVPTTGQTPRADSARDDSPPSSPIIPPRSTGRTRAPSLVTRNVTSPSSLSRQLQNVQTFLPTSPQLPSLGFSNPLTNFAGPRITNVTVSGSSFNNQPVRAAVPTAPDTFVSPRESRRRSTGTTYVDMRSRDLARLNMTPSRGTESDEEDHMRGVAMARHSMRYPSAAIGGDKIVFASFAVLEGVAPTSHPSRLLFIGYENGLQIWETTHLGEVREVLNRRLAGAVVGCHLLPAPVPSTGRGIVTDAFESRRPLVGIIVEEHDACYLLVYSLASHEVITKLDFSGANVTSIQASRSFIVVSTTLPTSLHILCARTLNILHTLQSRQLSVFSRPVILHTPEGTEEIAYSARQDRPHAVFALSNRLLAFASVPPSPETSSLTSIYPRMAIPHSPSIQLGSLSVSQADIGNAAVKVGGGLLSGMRALGGMAVAAARGEMSTPTSTESKGFRKFFSRSAPSATPVHHERTLSDPASQTTPPEGGSTSSGHITILDLQPLLDDREAGRPERLSEFSVPAGQVVADLKFSEDGTNIAVIPNDGNIVRTYQIRPQSRVLRRIALSNISNVPTRREKVASSPTREAIGSSEDQYGLQLSSSESEVLSVPWHMYDLRRGRTSAVVEAVRFSSDCRWVGVVSRKRTVHVFATNPYGGKPDEASHLEGKVKNTNEIQPLSTELRPITRLRSRMVSSQDKIAVPLVLAFVPAPTEILPHKFQPVHSFSPPSSVASSLPSSVPGRRAQSISPRQAPKPTNYQDILVFDPSDGTLSLRRLTLSVKVAESGSSFLSSLPIPSGTSMSLPGMGLITRSSSSPPKSSAVSTPQEQLPSELVAKDTTLATWNLMRDSKWTDVREPIVLERQSERQLSVAKSEWLAQAELSTFSPSTRVLSGSIYLSHQFSFFGFSEDYHALIRRLHFDIAVEKIVVRKEVEASANISRGGETFISAIPESQRSRGGRPFDEPLASALYTGLDYSGTSPPVIPMLPNGTRSGSFKAALPIRSVAAGLTEGVNESIGRLSRGIRRVRSPRLGPRADESFVPLEFDEEDEDFLNRVASEERARRESNDHDNDNDTMSNSAGGRDSQSLSTPSTNNNVPLPETGSDHDGWLDNMDAVDEAEQFDEIDTIGYADAEQIRVPGLGAKGYPGRKGGR